MKKITYLTIILCVCIQAHFIGQSIAPKLILSEKIDKEISCDPFYLDAGANQKLMFYYFEKKKEFTFTLFNEEMKVQKTNTINQKNIFDKKAYFHGSYFRQFNNKTYMFFYQEKGKAKDIYVVEFSIDQLNFIGEPIKLLENLDNSLKLQALSPDCSKFLITTELEPTGSKGSQKQLVGIYIFDDKLKMLSENTISLPADDKTHNYVITNSGTVNTTRLISHGSKSSSEAPNFHYEIYSIEKSKKTPFISKINLGNCSVSEYSPLPSIIICSDNSASLYFICKKNKEDENEGIVFINIEPGKNNNYDINNYFSQVPPDIIAQYTNGKESNNIHFSSHHEAFAMQDGTTKIVCYSKDEYNSIQSKQSSAGYVEKAILFSGIYILSYNNKSKMEWAKKIPINVVGYDFYTGFPHKIIINENDLLIFYSDIAENRTLKNNQAPSIYERTEKNKDDGSLCSTRINAKGAMENYNLGRIMDFEFPITAAGSQVVGKDLMQCQRNEKLISKSNVSSVKAYTFFTIQIK